MNLQQLYEFCLFKPKATEHFPFDESSLVFKIGAKIFALTSLKDWENENPTINLKCDPEKTIELRATFEGVNPGFHMNKTHWNTVTINSDVSDKMIYELINHSYDLVFRSLTTKTQAEILELEN